MGEAAPSALQRAQAFVKGNSRLGGMFNSLLSTTKQVRVPGHCAARGFLPAARHALSSLRNQLFAAPLPTPLPTAVLQTCRLGPCGV